MAKSKSKTAAKPLSPPQAPEPVAEATPAPSDSADKDALPELEALATLLDSGEHALAGQGDAALAAGALAAAKGVFDLGTCGRIVSSSSALRPLLTT
jgi:hypothetical protein